MNFATALRWTLFWVACSLSFSLGLYLFEGPSFAINFLTGYLVEYALSVDNLFVILTIFSSFRISEKLQPRVLFWGVFGALVMRAVFILTGIEILKQFHWAFYIFGSFLVFTGLKTGFSQDHASSPEESRALKFIQKHLPFTSEFKGQAFFIKQAGKWVATPLFLTLLLVEMTDFMFALDSIPAILGITTDPLIVISSNFFAILGLRSLYFVLSHFLQSLVYLKYALAVILCFVGIKMIIADFFHISTGFSLLIILATLGISVGASLLKSKIK